MHSLLYEYSLLYCVKRLCILRLSGSRLYWRAYDSKMTWAPSDTLLLVMNCPSCWEFYTIGDRSEELMPSFSEWRNAVWSCVLSVVFNAGFVSFLSSRAQQKGHPCRGKLVSFAFTYAAFRRDLSSNSGIIISQLRGVNESKWEENVPEKDLCKMFCKWKSYY